ncbi:MAG: glycosyltransferase [Calditrichaeota bacterium]|nr:MAG: glycosyltransferase [Calditrichota bacterium]
MSMIPEISIIIVNYNVRDFLEQCLISVRRALRAIEHEIIVVDNNSVDGSVAMLRERFPEVTLLASSVNLGFSGGNNLALKQARGRFIVLLNPDTVVQEDTFEKLLAFFRETPDASAATCKILNPDGSFSVDCRHSIPTPSTAFWKLLGLNKVFPKSKIFGRYNLTFLDENETYPVEAISGSFMMIRRETVEKVGLLDDTFFMYCEDIDYCHRINQSGGRIYYTPVSQIIHYKGESSKANNLDYVITFNRSLYQFYKKHYQQKYITPFKWLILLGVILRGAFIFTRNTLRTYFTLIVDIIMLNAVLLLSFYVRFEWHTGFYWENFFRQYIVMHGIITVTYLFNALFFNMVKQDRFSPEKLLKTLAATFIFVSALTFFFRQFAFSRLVVAMSAVGGFAVIIGWRALFNRFMAKNSGVLAKEFYRKRALIVGEDQPTLELLRKLDSQPLSGIEIYGVVSRDEDKVGEKLDAYPIVTSLQRIEEYVRFKRINLIIFSTHNIAYERILETMSRLYDLNVEMKMVPGHLEYMIGKAHIERLDEVPLVEIDYAYNKPFNRFIKRLMDIGLSLIPVLLLFPLVLIAMPFNRKKYFLRRLSPRYGKKFNFPDYREKGLFRFWARMFSVLLGRISLVGAPIQDSVPSTLVYKPGLTGMVQLYPERVKRLGHSDELELSYLKNHSLFLDMELLLKALLRNKKA